MVVVRSQMVDWPQALALKLKLKQGTYLVEVGGGGWTAALPCAALKQTQKFNLCARKVRYYRFLDSRWGIRCRGARLVR